MGVNETKYSHGIYILVEADSEKYMIMSCRDR